MAMRPYTPRPCIAPLGRSGRLSGVSKGAVTRRINALRETSGRPVWQRNYYEHIVRDEEDLERIRAYMSDNPRRWPEDEYHPI